MATLGDPYNQLIQKGAEDFYLTEGPRKESFINWFARIYVKYIDFSETYYEQQFSGTSSWGTQNINLTLLAQYDILEGFYIHYSVGVATDTALGLQYAPDLGFAITEYVEVKASGVFVDQQSTRWFEVFKNCFVPDDKKRALNDLIGHENAIQVQAQAVDFVAATVTSDPQYTVTRRVGPQVPAYTQPARELYVPIPMMCLFDSGWAFSTIEASRSPITVNVRTRLLNQVLFRVTIPAGPPFLLAWPYVDSAPPDSVVPTLTTSLFLRTATLDPEVRDKYQNARRSTLHMYIAENSVTFNSPTVNLKLNFRNHCALLFPLVQETRAITGDPPDVPYPYNYNNFTNNATSTNPITETRLITTDANNPRYRLPGRVTNSLIPFERLPTTPPTGFNCIAFSQTWDSKQPRGTFNFSRFNNSSIEITAPAVGASNTATLYVIGVMYTLATYLGGTFQREYN
jgi:hypothetical protein